MRWVVAFLACSSLASLASAAEPVSEPTVDVQLFRPSPGGNNFFTTESGDVNTSLGLSVGLGFNYARNPLSIEVLADDGSQEPVGVVIKNRLDANLLLGFGLFDIADIGVVMPLVYQGGYEGSKLDAQNIALGGPKSFTQGDLRVVPKIRFMHLGDGAVSGALVANISIPTGKSAAYASDGAVVIAPMLALSSRAGAVRLALNAGYRMRDETAIQTLVVDDQLIGSLAVGINLSGDPDRPFEIVGEVFGHTAYDNVLGLESTGREKEFAKAATSLEGELGLRLSIAEGITVSLGAGGGILPGYGAPAPRVFAGITYYSGQVGAADTDRDRVPDDLDQCPDKREDLDGFQDDDGCPDLDNDGDKVLDEDDQCRDEAEDRDGFQDEDGCADPDNDGDGFLDAKDSCATEAEDKDGFEDDDGCPDFDNDGDGIADAVDKCPMEAEDKDGFKDGDGCPEPDNDGDGLTDLGDLCPNNPEDMDGVEDDDGCAEDNDRDGVADEQDKCPSEAETYNGIDDEDGCPERLKIKQLVRVTEEKIEIKEKIFFKTNSAAILKKSNGLLDQVAAVLKNYKHLTRVRIEGHTDSSGNKRRNTQLSRERAEAVKAYLADKGVDPARLEAEGFGPEKPIASNKTPRGREQNRRVEFVIVEQKPIGVDVGEPEPVPEPIIEMGDMVPATTEPPPPPSAEEPLFEMEVGPEPAAAPPAAAPPAPEPKPKKKAKKKAPPKQEEPEIDFNF